MLKLIWNILGIPGWPWTHGILSSLPLEFWDKYGLRYLVIKSFISYVNIFLKVDFFQTLFQYYINLKWYMCVCVKYTYMYISTHTHILINVGMITYIAISLINYLKRLFSSLLTLSSSQFNIYREYILTYRIPYFVLNLQNVHSLCSWHL